MIVITLTECLPTAKHCSRHFTYIKFNFHSNLVKYILLFLFYI